MELKLFEKDNLEKFTQASQILSESAIIPYNLRGKPQDIFAILVYGSEIGLGAMTALQSMSVIQGKITLNAQTMLSIVRANVSDFSISYEFEGEGDDLKVTAYGQRNGGKDKYHSTWDFARASAMGLIGKDNYKKQRRQMFTWRATSDVCRFLAPECLNGLLATEDFKDEQGKILVNVENEAIDGLKDDLAAYEKREKEEHPEWFNLGCDEYKFRNGKFREKQIKEVEIDELEDYLEVLGKRESGKGLKSWEQEVKQSITLYLEKVGA